jgi:transcriptional regulator with XRE-family HTH domain
MAIPEHVSRALAAEIADRCKAKHMSQAELAKRAGFRWVTSYQRLEHHERIANTAQLVAIANALEVEVDVLMRAARIRAAKGDFPDAPHVGAPFGLG